MRKVPSCMLGGQYWLTVTYLSTKKEIFIPSSAWVLHQLFSITNLKKKNYSVLQFQAPVD